VDSTTKTRPRWVSERWRPIAGWEGLYEVSEYGRVRRTARTKKERYKLHQKIIRPIVDRNFELNINLWDRKRRKKYRVKQLVMAAFIRNYNGGRIYCKDGDKKNCHVNNLWEKGNPKKKKLSEEELLGVLLQLMAGHSGASIARNFNVSRAAISAIKRKRERARDQKKKESESLDV